MSNKIIWEIFKRWKKANNHAKCYFPWCDSKDITKAHAVSKSNHLKKIANKSNKIYWWEPKLWKTLSWLYLKWIQQATTFKWLCNDHDRIFNEIDNNEINLSDPWEQLFLYTYRSALAQEWRDNYTLISRDSKAAKESRHRKDKWNPLYNEIIQTKNYQLLNWFYIHFDQTPIYLNNTNWIPQLYPDWSIIKEKEGFLKWPEIHINTFLIKNWYSVLFSRPKELDFLYIKYFDQLIEMHQNIISDFCLKINFYKDWNLAVSPEWYEGQPEEIRKYLFSLLSERYGFMILRESTRSRTRREVANSIINSHYMKVFDDYKILDYWPKEIWYIWDF